MAQNVVYADLKFAEGSPSTVPDEDDSPYENVLPGPVTAAPSPEHSPRRWHIPKALLPASLVLLLLLLVAIVALGACYWQVTRSLQDTSHNYAAEQDRLSQELSAQEQSLEQAQVELAWAREELQRAWHEGNISQLELDRMSIELGHIRGVLSKTEKEMQEVQGKLNNSKSTVSSLRACVNTDCCPSGWVLYRSKCLFISVQKKTWQSSKDDCKEKSAELLIQDSLLSLTVPHFVQESTEKYWIGASIYYDTRATSKWQDSSQTWNTVCRAIDNGKIRRTSCWNYFQWICEKSPKLSSTSEAQPPLLTKV
ncbi:B-cell differentiation antigen CD72-like isoform X1 [Chiroxiphia lanceolata]|uniref:B-cell differentiation antigen CD72-like isoform X1 n=1 Tax=Chiroxiphia lanceolata TaxID=296741 RepID=UPI0013CE639A|nr:B-cell differentiation antigen CD72-like isoform X1 [Chiroxiphia lanceolata]